MDTARKDENGKLTNGNVRVYKKVSPNGKITLYLGRREYLIKNTTAFAIANANPALKSKLSASQPQNEADDKPTIISGVVVADPEYSKERRVFVQLEARFRHGKEDDAAGMSYEKPLFLMRKQLWPKDDVDITTEDQSNQTSNSRSKLQERLLKKLKELNTFPFAFELPANAPVSVTLEQAADDPRRELRCGVQYELRAFVSSSATESATATPQRGGAVVTRPQRHSSVALLLRIVKLAPEVPRTQPYDECTKHFLASVGRLKLEATLDKSVYAHGEAVQVNVLVCNNTSKQAKRIKLSILQRVGICLHNRATFKCALAELDSDEGFPINANQTGWCKVYRLSMYDRPAPNKLKIRQRRTGLALEGRLKPTDSTLLASTSLLDGLITSEQLGVVVSYEVRVKLRVGFGADVKLRLPFVLARSRTTISRELDALDQIEVSRTATTANGANDTDGNPSNGNGTGTSNDREKRKSLDDSEVGLGNRKPRNIVPPQSRSACVTPSHVAVNRKVVESARSLTQANATISIGSGNREAAALSLQDGRSNLPDADADLIKLDDIEEDETADDALVDAIFEDFAKMRVKESVRP